VWWILKSAETPPVALTIAGSDPGAGAGIQADLKVFAAHGVYGGTVLAALTVQNTLGVSDTLAVPVAFIRAQFRALKEDLRPAAVKTGMLLSAEIVEAVAHMLGRPPLPLVVDPVLASSSGRALMEGEGLKAYREKLIPLATVLTPNLDEAARLLGAASPIQTLVQMREACVALLALGCRSVYLKGGHLPGESCVDLFYDGEFLELKALRIETKNTHGTGCALSAALTANLAKGLNLKLAALEAKAYVQGALEGAKRWEMGQGQGPLAHFFKGIG
jgi:hydroxymethylpyrimidine/phosphomethylpyrimidine kinase